MTPKCFRGALQYIEFAAFNVDLDSVDTIETLFGTQLVERTHRDTRDGDGSFVGRKCSGEPRVQKRICASVSTK